MRKQWDTEKKLYTLCILTEDTPGILSQVARLFSRKGYNIESIVSGATDRPHTARISIELLADELVVNQLATQCRRLLGVQAVKIFDEETCIRREIALIKLTSACVREGIFFLSPLPNASSTVSANTVAISFAAASLSSAASIYSVISTK